MKGSFFVRSLTIPFVLFITLLSVASSAQNAAAKHTGKALKLIAEDFATKKVDVYFAIEDEKGVNKRLKFKDDKAPAGLKTGDRITVHGNINSKSEIEVQAIEISADSSSSIDGNNLSALALQVKKAAVVLIDSNDGTHYRSAAQMENDIWGGPGTKSVRDHYLTSTFGNIDFVPDADNNGQPDIYGPVKINDEVAADCSYSTWGSLARQELGNSFDATKYNHVIYVLPSNSACGWWGIAVLSGGWSFQRSGGPFVPIHELGHNLSLHHASTDPENDGTINSEYGDHSCPMGNSSNPPMFNAVHSEDLGVHTVQNGAVLENVRAGNYDLIPLSKNPAENLGTQILKIPVSETNTSNFYYISFRDKGSYDSSLGTTWSNKVSVHKNSGTRSYFIKALNPGEVFTDAASGLSVTAVELAADLSSFKVNINVTCGSSQPTLSLSSVSNWIAVGGSANLNLTVKNNDNSFCPNTNFTLSSLASSGLIVDLQSTQLNLSPGEQMTLPVTLTENGLVGSGTLEFSLEDLDGLEPHHTVVKKSMNVSIDNTAPSSPSNLTATLARKNQVSLSWSGSTDNLSGVKNYIIYRDSGSGYTQVGIASYGSYTDNPGSGTHSYYVVAVDGAGNVSNSSNTQTVTISSGGKGGSGSGGKGRNK